MSLFIFIDILEILKKWLYKHVRIQCILLLWPEISPTSIVYSSVSDILMSYILWNIHFYSFIFRLTYYLHSHYHDRRLLTSALWDWNCRYDVIVYLIFRLDFSTMHRIYTKRKIDVHIQTNSWILAYASFSIYLVAYFLLLVIQEIVFNQLFSRSKTVVHCIVIKTEIAIWNILQRL